jgi:hypothetical protein
VFIALANMGTKRDSPRIVPKRMPSSLTAAVETGGEFAGVGVDIVDVADVAVVDLFVVDVLDLLDPCPLGRRPNRISRPCAPRQGSRPLGINSTDFG